MTRLPSELIELPNSVAPIQPVDLIKDVLGAVRLNGAFFLSAEYTAPWAHESPLAADLAAILQPGARRLVLFHIIADGECWISTDKAQRLQASAGDVIVLPYAEQHVMASPDHVAPVPIASLLSTSPWQEFPVIRMEAGAAVRALSVGTSTATIPSSIPSCARAVAVQCPTACHPKPSGSRRAFSTRSMRRRGQTRATRDCKFAWSSSCSSRCSSCTSDARRD